MDIFSVFTLCEGLAFFLYGMGIMSEGLEKIAGGSLEKLLKKMTSNPFKSLVFGASITAIIQSSSAVTVMLVGLVNSGIMKLSQAIGVIMGSNIGTTATAWILSLTGIESSNFWVRLVKPETFSPILAFVGIILMMTARRRKRKNTGIVLIGFAILMFGMELMKNSMSPLSQVPAFTNALTAFSNPIFGVLAGTIVTAIIQSSSASVGILQALSMTGGLTYNITIPIIMGQNIGTCVSALISSIGVNNNAKRVAVVHILFNVIGVMICLTVFEIGNFIFHFDIVEKTISPFGIAIVHSIFNLVTTFLLFPFTNTLEKLANFFVKDDSNKTYSQVLIDERLLITPSFAIAGCNELVEEMANIVRFNFFYSTKMLKNYHSRIYDEIESNEKKIDYYEDKLKHYLLKLSAKELTEEESSKITQLLLIIGDYERIGDHSKHILKIARKFNECNSKLSLEAISELKVVLKAVSEMFSLSLDAYRNNDVNLAQQIEPLEIVVKKIIRKAQNKDIQRLKENLCSAENSFIYVDLLNNLRKISAHCGNIAISVLQLHNTDLGKHEYNHRNKDNDFMFLNNYKNYKDTFSI